MSKNKSERGIKMSKLQGQREDIVTLTDDGIAKMKENPTNFTDETKPIPPNERSWSTWHTGSLWIGIVVSIAMYQIASGFIVSGMNWYQALFTVVLGHTLVMLPAVLLGHFGVKFGMSFPMMAKAVFGLKGSIIPSLVRSIVGIFWFGIQSWIGGQAVNIIIYTIIPSWKNLGNIGLFISFLIVWAFHILIVLYGAEAVKKLESLAAPLLLSLTFALIIWSLSVADWSFGRLLSDTAVSGGDTDFWILFFPALSAMIAFDGGPALSMADFTRHNKTQKQQVFGQLAVAPLMAAYIAFVGICGTAASNIAFGEPIWEPAVLAGQFDNPIIVIAISLFILMAVFTTNVAGNLVPPTIAFSTLFPKTFSYRRATFFSGFLGLLTMPWYSMANPSSFINIFLGSLGTLLGPITGIFIASYWFEHKQELSIIDMYRQEGGKYNFSNGWNKAATVVFVIMTAIIILGSFVPALKIMYNNSYVLGGTIAGLLYYFFAKRASRK